MIWMLVPFVGLWPVLPVVGLALIFLTGYTTDRLARKYQPPLPEASEQDWFFDRFTD